MKRLVIILVIGLSAVFCFFKLATLSKKPESIVFVAPPSEPTPIASLDASYLKIEMRQNQFEVSLFEQRLTTSKLDSIQAFISINENRIDKEKVAVLGTQEMDEFQNIASLLKTNGINRFRLNSK